jgi:hypothetical protein
MMIVHSYLYLRLLWAIETTADAMALALDHYIFTLARFHRSTFQRILS